MTQPVIQQPASSVRLLVILLGLATALGASSVLLVFLRLARPSTAPAGANLPKDFGTVPAFTLTERSGRSVTAADLAGRVSVFGFVFTRCFGTCPMVTATMAELRHRMPSTVQFVSISVDPDHDRPEVLAEYARSYQADHTSWWFLTGPRGAIYELIRNGFHLGVEQNSNPKEPGEELITHSTKLAVVDQQGRLRGYFDSSDPAAMKLLVAKVRSLLEETE